MKRDAAANNDRRMRLFDRLAAEPWAHDFFAVLRRIDALWPEQPRLGSALRPALRAGAPRAGPGGRLRAGGADVASTRAAPAPPRLGVRFFGLFGPMGPLPLHLTEYARDRLRNHADPTVARFADLFHHRALLLFYRAWAQAQPAVQADRPDDDQFAKWLGALFGQAGAAFRNADAVPDAAKRFVRRPPGARDAQCRVDREGAAPAFRRADPGRAVCRPLAEAARRRPHAPGQRARPALRAARCRRRSRAARSGIASTSCACTSDR